MVKNSNKVPKGLWKTFKTDLAKKVFNDVFDETILSQGEMTHPKQTELPQAQWQTLCWNFACHAAWATCEE